MPVAAQGGERAGRSECLQIAAVERGTRGEILDAPEGPPGTRGHEARSARLRQPLYQAQTEAQCRLTLPAPLERRVPVADAHIYRAHFDALCARIAHQLRRGVEAHRLAVEQRAGEGGGLMTLEPGRVIHQQREAHRMRLGETVFAEAEHLLVNALREIVRIALDPH